MEARELSLLTEIPRELTVVGDGFWLRQAFLNVLRNSVQHTPSGGTIRCRGWEEGESVVVEIADTGSGIAREEEEKIFERFYRPREDAASGTGIGLHLARQILEQQGGPAAGAAGGKGRLFPVYLHRAVREKQKGKRGRDWNKLNRMQEAVRGCYLAAFLIKN